MIKLKYFEDNKSFFKYFEKYYINKKKFKIEFWNYTNDINNNINNSIIFFLIIYARVLTELLIRNILVIAR